LILANHHVGNIPNLEKTVVVYRDREYVDVLAVALHALEVSLQQPLDADVGNCWQVELAAANAQVILENQQEAVFAENFPNHSLSDIAPLERLLS
jgi:hypothetical protein